MPLQLITAPGVEPIHVDEARRHIKQDIEDDDTLIVGYVGAARGSAESQTQRQLIAARYKLVLDAFPGPSLMGVPMGTSFSLPDHALLLPKSPLLQVVSVQYLDMSGALQTMPPADYTVDAACEPPRITPVFGKIWPIALPQIGAVQVTFDAGYAAPLVADATADTIAVTGWKTLAIGDPVRLSNSGGDLPAPLIAGRDYYIQSVISPGVYTLAATIGGAKLDLTDAGTDQSFIGVVPAGIKAWMLVRLDSLYSHRGETAVVKGKLEALPYVDRLLDPYRVVTL